MQLGSLTHALSGTKFTRCGKTSTFKSCTSLARNEAAQAQVYVLHVRHVEKRQSRFYGSQYVHMSGQWVIAPLWLSSRQLWFDGFLYLAMIAIHSGKTLVQHLVTFQVECLTHLQCNVTCVDHYINSNISFEFNSLSLLKKSPCTKVIWAVGICNASF